MKAAPRRALSSPASRRDVPPRRARRSRRTPSLALIAVGLVLVIAVVVTSRVNPGAGGPAAPLRTATACTAGADDTSEVPDSPTSAREPQAELSTYPPWGLSQGFQPLDLDGERLGALLDGIRSTGTRVVRLDLPWGRIQAAGPGCLDFAAVLRVYDAAQARGLAVFPVTSGTPEWTRVGAEDYAASYESFLDAAGRVLIPRGITTVELLNEANLTGMSPTTYTREVLIPGATGFRRAGAELGQAVTIVSSGPGPAETRSGRWSQLDFVRGLYAAGGRPYFDVLGTHPYVWPEDPAVPSDSNWLQKTVELREVMVRYGDTGKQIWATEFGVPTNTGARGVDEDTQARQLADGAAVWRSFPWAGLLVFYAYQDLAGSPSDPESHFGLVTSDGRAKPALAVVRRLVSG